MSHPRHLAPAAALPSLSQFDFHDRIPSMTGPVLVDRPTDVQIAQTEFVYPEAVDIRSYKPTTTGHPTAFQSFGGYYPGAGGR